MNSQAKEKEPTLTIESVDKINVEDLIKDFKVENYEGFTSYLKEIWKVVFLNLGPF